jgi:hypothetical protein
MTEFAYVDASELEELAETFIRRSDHIVNDCVRFGYNSAAAIRSRNRPHPGIMNRPIRRRRHVLTSVTGVLWAKQVEKYAYRALAHFFGRVEGGLWA